MGKPKPLFVLGALTLYVMIKVVKQSPSGVDAAEGPSFVEGMASGMNMKKKREINEAYPDMADIS